jgi:hypothetical protein
MIKTIFYFIISLIAYVVLFFSQDKTNIIFLSTIGCTAFLVSMYHMIEYMEK